MKKHKFCYLLIGLFGLLLLASCGSKDKGQDHADEAKGFDMESLLTAEMLKEAYHLDDTVSLEPDFGSRANYINYDFSKTTPTGGKKPYSVALNFYSATPSTPTQLEAMWKSQNEGVYAKSELTEVSGVGKRASWCNLGGGQLRVITDKYLFYITTMWGDKDLKKDKAIALAKEIVSKL